MIAVTSTGGGYASGMGGTIYLQGRLDSVTKSYEASTGTLTVTMKISSYHAGGSGSIVNCYGKATFDLYKI